MQLSQPATGVVQGDGCYYSHVIPQIALHLFYAFFHFTPGFSGSKRRRLAMLGIFVAYHFQRCADQSRAWQQALMHLQAPCWALRTSRLCDERYRHATRLKQILRSGCLPVSKRQRIAASAYQHLCWSVRSRPLHWEKAKD